MASTYTPIATTTLSVDTSRVTFSSISGSYTDLVLIVSARVPAVGAFSVTLNSDSASNYSRTVLYGDGTSALSGRFSNALYTCGDTYNGMTALNFMNYSNTTTYKTFLARGNVAGSVTNAGVTLWRSTAAINRIDLDGYTANFSSGSTFTLYGIQAA